MDNKEDGHYFLQLNKVIQDKTLPIYILKAVNKLKADTYLTAGDYFALLDEVDLKNLRSAVANITTTDYKEFEIQHSEAEKDLANLSLLCFVLALGEGEAEITPEALQVMLQCLVALIKIESLYRAKHIEVKRENFSILDIDKPIAKAIKKDI